jgi:DNA repair exonuclease SbcCD ATPase subunit
VDALVTEMAALPPVERVTDADVQQAQVSVDDAGAAHELARKQLDQTEGSLAHVGGAALREEQQRLEDARAAAGARERELEVDGEGWKMLRDTLREAENEEGTHLGRALAVPVGERFAKLTQGRYGGLLLDAAMRAEGLEASAASAEAADVLQALSVGTRGQLAALIRLSVADQLRSAVILDDHLVHTDDERLDWFGKTLLGVAVNAQVVVITCRPHAYLAAGLLPAQAAACVDLAAGTIRAVDLGRSLRRYAPEPPP